MWFVNYCVNNGNNIAVTSTGTFECKTIRILLSQLVSALNDDTLYYEKDNAVKTTYYVYSRNNKELFIVATKF
ncbi:MAG: hypothetical protein IJ593_11410 [Lachnospiraceae bacterium]|nr:hypothetical protein [Lachnospiraceae bacterium]